MYVLRDYIGVYAPIILFFLAIFLLRNTITYLQFFLLGFILNNISNIILKLVIKEPRPSTDQKHIEIAVVNNIRVGFDKFGMPSGHAQNSGYCLTFITMSLFNPFITGLFIFISVISLYQRYLYNNHTFLQLIVGFIIGAGIGYFSYFIGNKQLTGDITTKHDDNGPM